MSDVDLARLVEAAAADREPSCYPPVETMPREDVRATTREYPFKWGSSVSGARWSEGNVEERIDEVMEFFRARGRSFVWWIGPSSTPAGLPARLERRGFVSQGEFAAMTAELPLDLARTSPAIEVIEVHDERTALDSVRVSFWQATDDQIRWLARERADYVRCAERRGGFVVGYLDGKPVSTAFWRDTPDGRLVYFGGGATPPAFRGRGAYSALVAYRAARAAGRGVRWAAVSADRSTSAPILARRGFRDHGPLLVYDSPEWVREAVRGEHDR